MELVDDIAMHKGTNVKKLTYRRGDIGEFYVRMSVFGTADSELVVSQKCFGTRYSIWPCIKDPVLKN